jgi:Tol biopolymer transport system component
MRPDGSRKHRLTDGPGSAKRGALSPDGRWIAFDGAPGWDRGDNSDFDIQLMRADGTQRRRLTRTPDRDTGAAWSPDGRLIAFTRRPGETGPYAIWVVRPDGGGMRRLRSGGFPAWAPDGRRLAFAQRFRGQFDLYTLDLRTRAVTHLTRTPGDEFPAAWSPDGRWLLLTRYARFSPDWDVYRLELATGSVRRLTWTGTDDAAAWSPDGSRVLFTTNRTGRAQVFVMRPDGSRQRSVSRNRTNEYATSWGSLSR